MSRARQWTTALALAFAGAGVVAAQEPEWPEADQAEPADAPPEPDAGPDEAPDEAPAPHAEATRAAEPPEALAQDDEIPPPPEPPGAGEPREAASAMRLMVLDASADGVAPVVARHVTAQVRITGADMGYAVIGRDATVAAASRLRMPHPPSPADLWRATYAARAHRGAFARVWASGGRYVMEITVASMDGTGPFSARATSGADDLHVVVDRLLRQALPATTVWVGGARETEAREASDESDQEPVPRRRRRRPTPAPAPRRFSAAAQTEAAFGTSSDSFYNHLLGLRLDYRVSQPLLFGAYLGYANLRGKDGRASNVLVYAQIENRVRITAKSDVTLPLRFGLGYLPLNGPVVRLAAGLAYPLSSDLEIEADILAPTFWVLPSQTAVSMDFSIELSYRL